MKSQAIRALTTTSAVALAYLLGSSSESALASSCAWGGGNGLWTTATSWSCNAEPGSGDSVSITVGSSIVNITGINAQAGTLSLAAGNVLNITSSNLVIYDNVFSNDGTVNVTGSQLDNGASNLAISGSGTIVLSGGAELFNDGGTDTIGAGQTVNGIDGSNIGENGALIVNNGVIAANGVGDTLTIDPAGGSGGASGSGLGTTGVASLVNNNLLTANNSSTLLLNGGQYDNSSGVISATNNSLVSLNNDARIIGGSLTSDATSAIVANGTGTQYLQNVTLTNGSTLNITSDNVQLNTALTNNGTITVNSGQIDAETAALTINGTGAINLTNGAELFNNGGIDTLGAGQTVSGGNAYIGENSAIIVNDGTINANVSGQTLTIDPLSGSGGVGSSGVGTGGASAFLNSGTLEATGGGTLLLNGGLYENSAGHAISAIGGSTVSLNNDVRILNGALTSDATSTIAANGAGSQYLQNVTLTAGTTFNITSDNVFLDTAFVNNGTVNVFDGQLDAEGNQNITVSGTGTINLTNSNLFNNGGIDTLGSNQTVTGTGSNIGGNSAAIVNDGNLSINGGSSLTLDVAGGSGGLNGGGVGTGSNSGFYNDGTVTVSGGSSLLIDGGLYENAAGHGFVASGGSTINLNNDVRILNGSLTSDATSTIAADATGSQYLQNVTLTSGTTFNITGDNVFLDTAFVNNGTVNVVGGQLDAESNQNITVSGTGSINLTNSDLFNSGGIDTLGSNQTVTGTGSNIGGNSAAIVNDGNLSINGGSSLTLDVAGGSGGLNGGGVGTGSNSGFYNDGTVTVSGGSSLLIDGGLYENAAGHGFVASGGSTINLNNDVRILDGSLTSDATSMIAANSTGSQYLQNVTLTSGTTFNITSDNVYLNTALANNGTINVVAGSLNAETAAVALTGTGTINLSLGSYLFNNGGVDTIGAGQTVNGTDGSNIGANSAALVNYGVIASNTSGGNLIIDPTGGSGGSSGSGLGVAGVASMVNYNLMTADNASTLSLYSGQYDNTGAVISATNSSQVALGNDVRIIGGSLTSDAASAINAIGTGTQYLQNVTLTGGSTLNITNDNVYLNTDFTNDGTTNVTGASLNAESSAVTIDGTGVINLDGAQLFDNGGIDTIGSGQVVNGTEASNIGGNSAILVNSGIIDANTAGQTLAIDPQGGNGGLNGTGVGTGGNSAFLNSGGTIEATASGTLQLYSGLYENTATGTIAAVGAGSTVNMNNDSSLLNLQAGGVLSKGIYTSQTDGAASVLDLQSNQANAIVQIGTNTAGTDTVVTLSGAQSTLGVYAFNQGAITNIDQSLASVAQSGELVLDNGRALTISANGGDFSNAGIVQLGGGTISAANSYTNTGTTIGNGTVGIAVANSGLVEASGGTLTAQAITGVTGTIRTDSGATLDLSGAAGNSTTGTLANNGTLDLGSHNITVQTDYTNAAFGSGNSFNNHANVSGTGLILAASATMDLSGAGLSGNTLDVGSVRTGGSSSTTFTITNNGTLTNLIGAVQNTNAPGVTVTGADWTAAANGGTANVTIGYTGVQAGSLSGQTIEVVNNFDNVASRTLNLVGTVYQTAQAGAQPATIALGAVRTGGASPTGTITIANTAPVTPGFNEVLQTGASTSNGFLLNGSGSATVNTTAGNSNALVLSHGTGTSGAFTGTVTLANTSLAAAGSGLSNLALGSQTINVSQNVYATAVANVAAGGVDFGVVRQGATSPTATLAVTNGATGALVDQLVTSVGSLPTGVSGTAPGALASGASGNVDLTLNTATAGNYSGTGTLNFVSHDSELSDASLASQNFAVSGTVTQLAQAELLKTAGVGTLSGSGNTLTLNLGTLTSGSGTYATDLAAANTNGGFSYSETLGGSFLESGSSAFSFVGTAFSGLVGGTTTGNDLLDFDTTGLGAGTYNFVITLDGYSQYTGLSDYTLGPIQVDVTATIQGAAGSPGAVPEPDSWVMMLAGFGAMGLALRRRKPVALPALATV